MALPLTYHVFNPAVFNPAIFNTGLIDSHQPAIVYAQAGVMRANASRANYHSRQVFVAIAGVQYASARATEGQQVENESLSITETDGETPNTCAFEVRGFVPEDGQAVVITLGSINNLKRLFAGRILTDASGYVGTPANQHDAVNAIDYTWELTRRTISQRWTNVSATTIATEIILDVPGFTALRVEADLPIVDEFTVTNQTHASALGNLAQRVGATWKATYHQDVRFGITAGTGGTDPTALTVASANSIEMTGFQVTRDLSQVITRQPVEGGGSTAFAEVAVGATVLAVTNGVWYNASGGLVVSGPQRITYTGLGRGFTPELSAWQTETPAYPVGTAAWNKVIWVEALGLFVAVGNSVAMTSPDGVTWTGQTIPVGTHVGLAWSPTLARLVTTNLTAGTVETSPDGVTWTTRTPSEANQWQGVTWAPALGLFVAVASTGTHRVMTSPDGITWTMRTAATVQPWNAIAWAPSLGLLVAQANVASGGVNLTMTSPDGITWTIRASGNGLQALDWSPALGLFVAVGAAGAVMTSPDGITWTARVAASTNQWSDVVWVPELALFLAVAQTTTGSVNQIMASSDGITWSGYPGPGVGAWTSVAWAASDVPALVAVATTGGAIQVMRNAVATHRTLTGIPASGAGAILYTIQAGDAVSLRVVMEDVAAQAVIAALLGGTDDGVIEGALIQDGRLSETEARARGQAQVDQRKALDVAVTYTTHDLNAHAARTQAVDLAQPACVGSFKLSSVTITNFLPARWPSRQVWASSTRFTFEDFLRRSREALTP